MAWRNISGVYVDERDMILERTDKLPKKRRGVAKV